MYIDDNISQQQQKTYCEIIEKGNKYRENDKLYGVCGQVERFRLVLHNIKIHYFLSIFDHKKH